MSDELEPTIGKFYLNGVEIGKLCGPLILAPFNAEAFTDRIRERMLRSSLNAEFGSTDPRLPEWP